MNFTGYSDPQIIRTGSKVQGDRGNLSKNHWADVFIDYRRLLVLAVVVISIVLACFVPSLETDTSLRSMLVTNVPAYLEYEKFTEVFGNEEFIIIGIKNLLPASDQSVLKSLESITNQLEIFDKVTEVISLTNLRFFQKREEKFGTFPVIRTNDGQLALPGASDLAAMRKAFPLMGFLISPNMQTVGLLVRVDDSWKFDSDAIRQVLADITRVVDSNIVRGLGCPHCWTCNSETGRRQIQFPNCIYLRDFVLAYMYGGDHLRI